MFFEMPAEFFFFFSVDRRFAAPPMQLRLERSEFAQLANEFCHGVGADIESFRDHGVASACPEIRLASVFW